MHHTRVWSLFTNNAPDMLHGGALTLTDRGEDDLRLLEAERQAFRAHFGSVPEGNMLYRFAHELREGDFVLLHQGRGKCMDVCRVTGEYDYDGAHRRPIRWVQRLLPEDISAGAQREITYASASVLFEVRHYAPEFLGDMDDVPEDGTAAERFAVRWARHRRFMEQRKAVTIR